MDGEGGEGLNWPTQKRNEKNKTEKVKRKTNEWKIAMQNGDQIWTVLARVCVFSRWKVMWLRKGWISSFLLLRTRYISLCALFSVICFDYIRPGLGAIYSNERERVFLCLLFYCCYFPLLLCEWNGKFCCSVEVIYLFLFCIGFIA